MAARKERLMAGVIALGIVMLIWVLTWDGTGEHSA